MLDRTDSAAETNAVKMPEARSYTAARQHSARVQRLKIILPVGAALISLMFVLVSVIRSYIPDEISVLGTKIEDGRIVMEKPAIAGRNKDGINYSMTAERALQDIRDPNFLTLETIKAAVPLNDRLIARVTAERGDYDRSSDRLNMTAPFDIDLSTGLRAHLASARIDVKGGTLESDEPVTIFTDGSSILANSVKITDKGHLISFAGEVRVNIDPVAIRNNKQQSGLND
ncbi:LPS export ABC transporter periplasmic protein LptC [Rhizobiaceae bacterium BDR2-2]|uniref:LPS export ABC transporter periplasmic protein LptC n=1 Tax=Ectorhizobium quercum TaxID=2965071 RepID=A0AAE3ST43_9HYPH|nr:LPS export ABC transporter periplasmic protein LptC [Ectorhizobium quercum]MCX8995765.1 LPS export ABC transporter periplasmic protein LptC [Ectorhizobium quercum]